MNATPNKTRMITLRQGKEIQDPGQPADEVETLIQTIHPRDKEPGEGKVTRSRRNSLTSQVVDLALLVTRKST